MKIVIQSQTIGAIGLLLLSFAMHSFSFGFISNGGLDEEEEAIDGLLLLIEIISYIIAIFSLFFTQRNLRIAVFILATSFFFISRVLYIRDRIDFILQSDRLHFMFNRSKEDYEISKRDCCKTESMYSTDTYGRFRIWVSTDGWIACIYSPLYAKNVGDQTEARSYVRVEDQYKHNFFKSFKNRELVSAGDNWYIMK